MLLCFAGIEISFSYGFLSPPYEYSSTFYSRLIVPHNHNFAFQWTTNTSGTAGAVLELLCCHKFHLAKSF